jgi:CHRD domain
MNIRATLTGFEEIPAISTPAGGTFTATQVSPGVFEYELSYSGLEANATQAHIHFGQEDVSGGIAVWLCSNLPSPPTPPGLSLPPCPLTGGTVTGTFNAASVVGPAGQGIDAGQIDELLVAIESGLTYCNVHSSKYLPGEVRGQIGRGRL